MANDLTDKHCSHMSYDAMSARSIFPGMGGTFRYAFFLKKLVRRYNFRISTSSLWIKVIGSSSRSLEQ